MMCSVICVSSEAARGRRKERQLLQLLCGLVIAIYVVNEKIIIPEDTQKEKRNNVSICLQDSYYHPWGRAKSRSTYGRQEPALAFRQG
jgi:hypothetical protein